MLRYKNYFEHIFMEEIKASNTIKIRKIMQMEGTLFKIMHTLNEQ